MNARAGFAAASSDVVTFLFTDVESSPRRREADAMRWRLPWKPTTGANMTNAGITAYVFDQIDRACAEVLASD